MSTATGTATAVRDGVGASTARPDGRLKVKGDFAYSSDLRAEGMVWGATLRSPHPSARIVRLDTSAALRLPGVLAVLTHEDVPGRATYGMKVSDQPVLAVDRVRYQGEPVALVAADHPETARRALALIDVAYEERSALTDPEEAVRGTGPLVHAERVDGKHGNIVRHVRIRHGDVAAARAEADVIVFPPSNPVVSVGTILAVPGIREAIAEAGAPVIGLSPIVGDAPVRGMADKVLAAVGVESTAAAVAEHYGAGLLDGWLVDTVDEKAVERVEAAGIRCRAVPLMMTDPVEGTAAAEMAREALKLAEEVRGA